MLQLEFAQVHMQLQRQKLKDVCKVAYHERNRSATLRVHSSSCAHFTDKLALFYQVFLPRLSTRMLESFALLVDIVDV